MLEKIVTASFPAPGACQRDQGVQHLVASRQAVPFLQIGSVARIEVVGIPALRCQICHELIYDLSLLERIESILHEHVAQGNRHNFYRFDQLAAELTADALPL